MSDTATTHAVPVELDVVTVEGPEAETYLQGQLSQEVAGLGVGETAWTFVLAPNGKVDALARLHRAGPERFLLLVDPGHGEDVSARLKRFKLRMSCEIASAETGALALRGPGAAEAAEAEGPSVVDAGWPTPGVDVLDPDAAVPAGATPGDRALYDGLRIAAGIPVMGRDVTQGSLAASSGMIDRAVVFEKGCFTGQELVARMESRGGTAPTRLVQLRGAGGPPEVGADVTSGDDTVGTLTSVAADPDGDGYVALASVSRRLAPDGDGPVQVGGEPVEVRELHQLQ